MFMSLITDVAIEEHHRHTMMWAPDSNARCGSANASLEDTTAGVAPLNTDWTVSSSLPPQAVAPQTNSPTPATAMDSPLQIISPPQVAVSHGTVSKSLLQTLTDIATNPSLNAGVPNSYSHNITGLFASTPNLLFDSI
jgi:hypothetical protein